VRYNPQIKRYYQRKRAKTKGVVAIKAVPHKLARTCYHILRTNWPAPATTFCATARLRSGTSTSTAPSPEPDRACLEALGKGVGDQPSDLIEPQGIPATITTTAE